MSSFTIGGLSTGIDYNTLISKLIEAKSQPIKLLQNKKTSYNDKMTKYSSISSKLSSLKSAAEKLKTSSNFYAKAVSVSDSTVLESTVTSSAAVGNYSVTVTSLASEEQEVHSGVTALTTVINNSGSSKVFQYTYAGTQRSLTVADGTTLEDLRDLINEDTSNPGVTATIVNDGVGVTPYRLIIKGDETGAANSITVDAGTTLDGSGSTTDFRSATFTQKKAAADSDFTIDSLQIKRSTNAITDVISGVTINLKKDGVDASSKITVTANRDAIKAQINEFVTAYNGVVDLISSNSTYDSTTKVSGALLGEGTARNIQNQLRTMISGTVSGQPDDMNILAQLGITTNSKTGQLVVNTSTMDTKLSSDLDDVAALFTTASTGIANQIYTYITNTTSTVDGSLTLRAKGLQALIKDVDDTVKNMQYRLDKEESDLVRKFTALESLVSGYNTIGSYLNRIA